jgi:hypothetical protein
MEAYLLHALSGLVKIFVFIKPSDYKIFFPGISPIRNMQLVSIDATEQMVSNLVLPDVST